MVDMDVRLADMDAAGIDMQVIMPPPGQCTYSVPLDIAVKAAEIINDGMAAFVAKRPERFQALGTVPMQDAAASVRALEGCMGRGLKGVQILTNVAGRELSDPAYAAFWEAAEAMGAVVLIHPNGLPRRGGCAGSTQQRSRQPAGDDRCAALPDFRWRAGAAPGAEAGRGAWRRVSGVLFRSDRPRLGRTQRRSHTLPEPPTTYLRRVFFDTVVFTPHQLTNLVEVFGAGQLVMGTDYPYDMAEADPIGTWPPPIWTPRPLRRSPGTMRSGCSGSSGAAHRGDLIGLAQAPQIMLGIYSRSAFNV